MPGAPFGPACFSTSTDVSSIATPGSSMRRCRSAWSSNTTARPRWVRSWGDAADTLMTAPPGQRLPCRMARPPSAASGTPSGRMTSSFQLRASPTLSASERPFTVGAAPSSSGSSARSTTGRPPA